MRVFIPAGGEAQENAVEQMEHCLEDKRAVAGALMADHHLGYAMPIGGVIAYDGAVSPSGVGYDIACGNKAVCTDLQVGDVEHALPSIMKEVRRSVAFGIGRTSGDEADHLLFEKHADILKSLNMMAGKRMALSQKARAQLGTVGSGNHYVDLLADEEDRVWVANHFGSRGLGHTIASGYLNLAADVPFDAPERERNRALGGQDMPCVINLSDPLGQSYVEAMTLAGDYAYAGRDYVIGQVLGILRCGITVEVHNHHNYAWEENGLWVVRKGATPLTTGLAFIGGSMGDGAVIVCGRTIYDDAMDCLDGVNGWVADIGALGSAPHGAGRVMSRTAAAGKIKTRREERTRPDGTLYTYKARYREGGVVDWPKVQRDLAAHGIVVLGSGADEAPEVYKPLDDVLAGHENIQVIHRLRTLGVVMAGADEFDPYKD